MVREMDNDDNSSEALCELCEREQWVKKINGIRVCQTCLDEIEKRKKNE
ncbi:MAG: hypothetical protein ACTSO3_00975 [Candidatus Heimdallarchaeaceae archaeon]